MCGLSGAAGSIVYNDEKVCKDLLFYNTLRGEDATGVGTIPRDGRSRWKISKAPVKAPFFLEMKRFTEVMSGTHRVILQHNRKATGGGRGEGYAHPWDFTHILGAHNGSATLEEIRKIKGNEDCLLDSIGILNAIDLYGPVETYKQITHYDKGSEFQNAWAVTWYDRTDDSVNFLRNWKRPLYLLFNDKHEVLYWSSEIGHLLSATGRNDVVRKEGENPYSVPIDSWVKFKIPAHGKPFEKPVIRKIEYRQPTVYSGSGHYSSYPSARETPGCTIRRKVWNNDLQKMVWEDEDESASTFRTAAQSSLAKHRGNPPGEPGEKVGVDAIRDENTRKSSLGKDKFILFYYDDNVKLYYDANVGSFFRYWWSEHDTKWHGIKVTGVPTEIPRGYSIADHLKEKRSPLNEDTGLPLAKFPRPDHQPVIDYNQEFLRSSGRFRIITKAKKSGNWRHYKWDDSKAHWVASTSFAAPASYPDTLYDINACHYYDIRGKREKRRVRYKGFNGKLLTQSEFNTATEHGCLICGRTPHWTEGRFGGVHVNFINKSHEFLCDFCAEDRSLMADIMKSGVDNSTQLAQEKHRRSVN